MTTPVAKVVQVDWKQVFPALALFRTWGLTAHVRQVFVGILGALAIFAVQYACHLNPELPRVAISYNWTTVFAPVADLVYPIEYVTRVRGGLPPIWVLVLAIVATVCSAIISAVAGGILVRRAAFEFSREETLPLRDAVRFANRRLKDYLSAPLLPMLFIAGMLLTLGVVGWVGKAFPSLQSLIAQLWLFWLFMGIGTIIILGIVLAAWPMMVAAVSVNCSDGFDALSRGFGFVLDRWRYYLACLLFVLVYGCALQIVLTTVATLAQSSVEQFIPTNPSQMEIFSPIRHVNRELESDHPKDLNVGELTLCLLLRGFFYAYFWSGMTVTYLLLRQSLDRAELTDLSLEGDPTEPDDLKALLNPQVVLNSQPENDPMARLLPIIDPPK